MMPARRHPPTAAEGQLALGISLPAARSARAELTDVAGKKSGSRARKAPGGPLTAWPALGDPVVALVPIDGPEGRLEAPLAGQFMGCDYDPSGSKTCRVRLDSDQPGLSDSLAASLPRQVAGVALGQLRRPG